MSLKYKIVVLMNTDMYNSDFMLFFCILLLCMQDINKLNMNELTV